MIGTVTPRIARLLSKKTIENCCRTIYTTRKRDRFHEPDKKGGYAPKSDYVKEDVGLLESIRRGYQGLIEELKLFKEEMKERFRMDPILMYRPGEVDVEWRFNGDPSILDKWVLSVDSDYGEGNSTASLKLTERGKAIFSGFLDPCINRDGKIKYTGYCNIASVQPRQSFQRSGYLNWGPYTHLVFRVRGDGRNYLLVLSSPGEFDILWNDSYHYVLHTRGGPYWQYVKIPFSKFYLTSKGRVQDQQQPVPTHRITSVGITVGDNIRGSFHLEIDYIGVECDHILSEEFAYEMYKTPHKFHV